MSTVRKAASGDRFELVDDAGDVAGYAQYVEVAGARVFFHTKVDDAHAGKGYGRELVEAALDATRSDGLHVMPVCPYVAKVVAGDQRWDDLVVTVTQDALDAVEERAQR